MNLDTNNSYYTWMNRRKGDASSSVRLDKVICNMIWLDNLNTFNYSNLIKIRSYHYLILLHCDKGVFDLVGSFKF